MKLNNLFIFYGNIANAACDIIVNAANGTGYMGGKAALKGKAEGVAESLNVATGGSMENAAMRAARSFPRLSSLLLGTKKGSFFITESCGLKCREIFHAVTIRYPGGKSDIDTVRKLLYLLARYCRMERHKTIALPLLGCGTGQLNEKEVLKEIETVAKEFANLEFCLYTKGRGIL